MIRQHHATVEGFTRFNARCGCGWFGPTRLGRDRAEVDAQRHNSPIARRVGFLS